MICNDFGVPFLAPLGMPELPFSNSGSYFLASLRVGDLRGIVSLWAENDDIDGNTNSGSGSNSNGIGSNGNSGSGSGSGNNVSNDNTKKQSTLHLYQELSGQTCYPGGIVSAKKLYSGVTTHNCIELMAKSEDSTEQALLKRKTFVLSCSIEKKIPFQSNVLTKEEKEKEETMYDRFFPSLDSFCQPDLTVGPAPSLSSREYKLVIMQSGTAVDEYILPLGEQILGLEALYLTVSTTTVIPNMMQLGQSIVMEKKVKRVFLACCTSVEDKHGEDTQGEGRIMLFCLDYALFQDAVVENSEGKEMEVENIDENTTQTSIKNSLNSNGILNVSTPVPIVTLILPQVQSKSQQSSEQSKFFKAIQPKLKLLWTGPGPASIVKQVGEFILSTVGTTVYIYRLNSETMELEQITFFFAQVNFEFVLFCYILCAKLLHFVFIFVLLFMLWNCKYQKKSLICST